MANFGFSLTPVGIFKVVGQESDWTPQQQIDCYQAASIGMLPTNEAKAKFVALLNILGISAADYQQVLSFKIPVEIYNTSGKLQTALSDLDKRKAIALKVFGSADKYKMLTSVVGEDLENLYNMNCKEKTDDEPFVLYRLVIGSNIVFKVSNEPITLDSLAHQAIKYLVQTKKVSEKDWQTELIS